MGNVLLAEPPARWAPRPRLVVDASIVAASAFGEPAFEQADAQMRGRSLCAPAIIDYELANVALTKIRARGVSSEHAARILASYEELDIERFNVDLPATVRIGDAYSLSSYDAAYIWVAGHLRAPIATFDARLAVAARSYLAQLPEPD
jgi:predicted nucleic acid-binding protein